MIYSNDFLNFEVLWDKQVGRDSAIHPEVITDLSISYYRDNQPERLIVHYMQPHQPYIHSESPEPWQKNPFRYLKKTGDIDKVWEGYINNLKLALDSVETLLSNMDAEKVLITSDHGELFGEWGLYSHAVGVPHPNLRKVPWVETSSRDKKLYEPDNVNISSIDEEEINDRLHDLGYL